MTRKTKVSLKSLCEADEGELAVEFDACLRMVEQDLRNRPEIEQPRKVTLTVTFKPGEDRAVVMAVDVIPHIPKRGPSARVLKIGASGMEMGDDRENPDQTVLENFTSKAVAETVDELEAMERRVVGQFESGLQCPTTQRKAPKGDRQ